MADSIIVDSEAGLSGWISLIESGISIYTKNIIEFTCDWFKISNYERHFLLRGTKYHDKITERRLRNNERKKCRALD